MAALRRKSKEHEAKDAEQPKATAGEQNDEATDKLPDEVTPQAAGDPGHCGETACWSRTPIGASTFTNTGRDYTFNSPWTGPVAYDFGDGTVKRGRGPTKHTYAAAGTFNVQAAPVASSCAGPASPLAVTVA